MSIKNRVITHLYGKPNYEIEDIRLYRDGWNLAPDNKCTSRKIEIQLTDHIGQKMTHNETNWTKTLRDLREYRK